MAAILGMPKEILRGICCGGHLAVEYGGELLYLRIFLELSPPRNFFKCELLKLCTHIGYRAVNHTIMCADCAK